MLFVLLPQEGAGGNRKGYGSQKGDDEYCTCSLVAKNGSQDNSVDQQENSRIETHKCCKK